MHPALLQGLEKLEAAFRQDDRYSGMFLWGSLGAQNNDQYSDLDIAAVVDDQHFDSIVQGFRETCETIFGPFVAWFVDGEADGFINFAVLFQSGDDLLLSDLSVVAWRALPTLFLPGPMKVVFDRKGDLAVQLERTLPKEAVLDAEGLLRCIEEYITYMYLHGKYSMRGDLWKIRQTQNNLFPRHLQLLKFMHPQAKWSGWVAKDVKYLTEAERDQLLVYSSGVNLTGLREVVHRELDAFTEVARRLCVQWGVCYPEPLECAVREHLGKALPL